MAMYDVFSTIIERFGDPDHAVRVPTRECDAYKARLPMALLDFWQAHGRGSYRQGKFWIADPALMQPVIDLIFKGDPKFHAAELTVFGYTQFGDLYCWHPRLETVIAEPVIAVVTNPGDPE